MRSKIFVVMIILIAMLSCAISHAEDRVSLGFLYGSTESISLIDRTKGAINQVAPTSFDLDNKGNLLISNISTSFVEQMHERGILVTPFLSNHWIRSKARNALKNADILSDGIINAINEYNLDGVNVDLENLTSDDKDDLTEFVRLLREKMPEGKILSVSVAANPFGREDGWQGSYDYEKLGEYSDYLFIMTYDEHSTGSPEGPVASNAFVENSIIYALNFVSKDKIVMGIPFFGRYWRTDEEYGGSAVVNGLVEKLLERKDLQYVIEEPEDIGETKITITVVDEMEKPIIINQDEWTSGDYIIWYNSDENIISKLDIINRYDLLGCGVWALGQERQDVWKYFKDELNKIPREEIEEKIEYVYVKDLAREKKLRQHAYSEFLAFKGENLRRNKDYVVDFNKYFEEEVKEKDINLREATSIKHGVKQKVNDKPKMQKDKKFKAIKPEKEIIDKVEFVKNTSLRERLRSTTQIS